LFAVLMVLGGLAACSSGTPLPVVKPPAPADGRPNIVFILTDDLATNLVRYMPHVRALAASGVSMRNYFVVDSLCCPSRAAIFTGLYPHDDGVFTNGGSDGGYDTYNRFGDPNKSFAIGLHAAGYVTGFMGKYLNEYQPFHAAAPGWDIWDVAGDGYPEYHYQLNENGQINSYGTEPHDYLTHVLSEHAVQFIHDASRIGQPFALEVATFAPHGPWIPAPLDWGTFPTVRAPRTPAFDRKPTNAPSWLKDLAPLTTQQIASIDRGFRRRVEMVQSVDRMIGHIEQVLQAEHQLNNTYFVFSSDNGLHMGEYGLDPGKTTAFDTDIRVPLVVAGPGIPAGRTIDAMASSIDLAPTLLQMAGARPAAPPDGVSLLSLLRGQPAPHNWQRAVLIEHHGPDTNRADPDVQPESAGVPPTYQAMRTATALYVEYRNGELEYYDLTRDPYELHNIAGTLTPQRLAQLHTQLHALTNCHGATACQHAATIPES
jgi:arylsulfatase A-like enzyme